MLLANKVVATLPEHPQQTSVQEQVVGVCHVSKAVQGDLYVHDGSPRVHISRTSSVTWCGLSWSCRFDVVGKVQAQTSKGMEAQVGTWCREPALTESVACVVVPRRYFTSK